MNLGQMLAQTAQRLPTRPRSSSAISETTYADFDKRANQVANGLIALGVQPGDRVALLLHNLPLFMEAYYGILKAGAAVVPMNVLYKPGEIEYIVKDSGAKALLTFASLRPAGAPGGGQRAGAAEGDRRLAGGDAWRSPLARRVRPGVRGPAERGGWRWRCRRHLLHLRHDGTSEGRDADTPQPDRQLRAVRASRAHQAAGR